MGSSIADADADDDEERRRHEHDRAVSKRPGDDAADESHAHSSSPKVLFRTALFSVNTPSTTTRSPSRSPPRISTRPAALLSEGHRMHLEVAVRLEDEDDVLAGELRDRGQRNDDTLARGARRAGDDAGRAEQADLQEICRDCGRRMRAVTVRAAGSSCLPMVSTSPSNTSFG